ncbi:MAG: LptA/OstA family protein [Janthinobacterium lividum]
MKPALFLAFLALSAAPLAAQTSALKRHDTDAPIDVDAQKIDVLDADKKAIWSGDVHIVQGTMKLDADTVTVFYSRPIKSGGSPVIERLDAQNNVKLVTPGETASGRYGIYDVAQKTITLVGGVTLTRGESVLRGQRLSIDLESGRSKLDGAGTPAAPGQPATTSGRVSGRFVVPPRSGK